MTPISLSALLSFLLLSLSTSSGSARFILKSLSDDPSLLLSTGLFSSPDKKYCDSWRLSVETNNAGKWATVPEKCVLFVGKYMNKGKYESDSDVVAQDALIFAKNVTLAGDGKDIWVFDVDETLLSNAPYYAANGWG